MPSMRNNSSRSVTKTIAVFLFKLRTRNSNTMVASILQKEREQNISNYSRTVLAVFGKDILSSRFGQHFVCKRNLIEEHITEIAKILYNGSNNY